MRIGWKRLRPCVHCVCMSCAAPNRFERIRLNADARKSRQNNTRVNSPLRRPPPPTFSSSCIQSAGALRRAFFTCWVNSATLLPLQIAVEKKKKNPPSVAFQLLIDSKKLVGSLRSQMCCGVMLQNWGNCTALSHRWPGNSAQQLGGRSADRSLGITLNLVLVYH